ncbi:MAG: hypothetical protein M5U13_16440 [Thermoanaerobaculia bacterium]|nr:hypothetical protein [Thermoanaerobaculia bacterium]
MTESFKHDFAKALNAHGHGFQAAVLQRVAYLFEGRRSPWRLAATEFPVDLRGQVTHIDFVLCHRSRQLRLVVECKRANPALSRWCFVRSPITLPMAWRETVAGECVKQVSSGQVRASCDPLSRSNRLYHLAFEMRCGKPGDPIGSSRGGIDAAVTQVLRGMNGLVDFLARDAATFLQDAEGVIFLPVVVTTAELWTSAIDLSQTDLASGVFTGDAPQPVVMPWLFLQYNQSPSLKHSLPADESGVSLEDFQWIHFTRSVAIVNASGVDDFFGREVPFL